jgi:hypothetical protein
MIDIDEAAANVVIDHLRSDLEFCDVYEDDRYADLDNDTQREIHGRAIEIMSGLADAIREGEIDLGYF